MTRLGKGLFAAALALWTGAAGRDAFDGWIDATVLPPLSIEQSDEVLDRNGDLLRAYTVADGRWRMAVDLSDVDLDYVDMLVRYEDKRFWDHGGIDLIAMGRAVGQAVWNGQVISGGSTLTMQVARLLEDGETGSWAGKLRQIRLALALEQRLSKEDILTLYLNRAPFGGNIEGVRAASLAWFGKPPHRLTPAEAALLVALPQSPSTRRPDRDRAAAVAARDRVLARMVGAGLLDSAEALAATSEPVPTERADFPALAPHLADRVLAETPLQGQHILTVDAALQAKIEDLARTAVADQGDQMQVAILIANHQTGEILAYVGSADYTADARQGFIDMTQGVRSPGSTLKPLIYGLAFDRGLVHPETRIADRPMDFGGYAPQNFDGLFRGVIRVRQALQLSLNIPAVSLLEAMGPQQLISALRRAGAHPVLPGGRPGLAIALGGLGLTLEDLVRLYAAIAGGGVAVDLRVHLDPTEGFLPQTLMGDVAAWEIADILLQTPRPIGVQGIGIAFKTGTSYGNRDAWAVGFDGVHVIGVWMGRADGTPVPGIFGGELAAPVLFDAFQRLKVRIDPIPPPPPATLLLPNAQLPLPLQVFRQRGESATTGGPEISFPPDGAVVEGDVLVVKVRDGLAPFTWLANGAPVITSREREVLLDDLGLGFSSLTVIDAAGRAAQADIELR